MDTDQRNIFCQKGREEDDILADPKEFIFFICVHLCLSVSA